MGFLFFGNDNKRHVKKLKVIADQVLALEEKYKQMSNDELIASTIKLKSRLKNGETLNDILPDAYATVREASGRVLNMRHFPVQIMGGVALHQGRIAEMATGEGKTLMATLPCYLNALTGNGVHVVTVNEYLAKRDAEWMGKVYKFLGLSVGVAVSNMQPNEKRQAYAADITYCTNNELGFDYLRDNMVVRKVDRVQRGHNFAIVDEVDSILIDEARTPLIISGRGMKSSEAYYTAQKFVKTLKDEDFEVEPKYKTINLTDSGITKAEKYFKVKNLSDVEHIELNHHIRNALRANVIMKRDENYIVKDNQVIIVDEFTGRLMPGRRYSEGLHQAIEAKEGVEIKDENKTLATITFQNYFRLYNKLSGMTGTAMTEEGEFRGIYNLDVVRIPPNLPNRRIDEPDVVYTTLNGKIKAIVDEIKIRHEKGQPVLVGTITIDKSEEISDALRRQKIPHTILNAKNHEKESEIVAQAGRKGAVTIATNMAGRGTDILLGGNPEFMAKKKMREENFTEEQISYATAFNQSNDPELQKAREEYTKLYNEYKKTTDKEKIEVRDVGGLHIIGTERHESRRIDNQLRGRAGRQGDPGSSIFYISLEDDLMKRFGGEKMQRLCTFFKLDEETPIQLKMLSKQIENAQKRIEMQNYASRKMVLQFDDVMNTQREIIYGERNKVLDGLPVHEQIMDMFPDVVHNICDKVIDNDKPYFDWDLEAINSALEKSLFPKDSKIATEEFVEECDELEFEEKILDLVTKRYDQKVEDAKKYGADFSDFERYILLRVVDSNWTDHIDEMSILKNEIGLRAYGNQDPVTAYKREGYDRFDSMINRIRETTSLVLLNTRLEVEAPPEPKAPVITATSSASNSTVQKTVVKDKKEPNRNDQCPCGSGKKYKNCHGKI